MHLSAEAFVPGQHFQEVCQLLMLGKVASAAQLWAVVFSFAKQVYHRCYTRNTVDTSTIDGGGVANKEVESNK